MSSLLAGYNNTRPHCGLDSGEWQSLACLLIYEVIRPRPQHGIVGYVDVVAARWRRCFFHRAFFGGFCVIESRRIALVNTTR